MSLWLAAALAAAAVLVSRPARLTRRLAGLGTTHHLAVSSRPSTASRVLLVGGCIGSAATAAGLPVPLAGLAGAVPVVVTAVRRSRAAKHLLAARQADVIEATFALAAELRAGRTSKEALAAAAATLGPLAPVLVAAANAVDVGGSAATELEEAAVLPGAERLRAVAAAWRVTEEAGGRVAMVLERLGEAMDRDDEIRRDLDAALAAPRATMMLLAGLPALGLGLGEAIGADPIHLLVYRPVGWVLLAGALTLDGLGILITRRITNWALQ